MYSRCIKINLFHTRYIKLYWTHFTDLMDSTKLGPSPFFRTEHRWPIYLRLRYKKNPTKNILSIKIKQIMFDFFLNMLFFQILDKETIQTVPSSQFDPWYPGLHAWQTPVSLWQDLQWGSGQGVEQLSP